VKNHGFRFRAATVLAASLAVALLFTGPMARADFVFLKNAKNDIAEASRDVLKAAYTGKTKTWKNGIEIEILLNATGSPELAWLSDKLVNAGPDVLVSKIKQEVFKGTMKKPEVVASAAECIAAVGKIAGGVCVVDAEAAKTLPATVQILRFSGS
jgi:hypothetical protein